MNEPPAALKTAKESLSKPNGPLMPAYRKLRADAEKARKQTPLSVLDKKKGLAGADPHDYVSYAPYFLARSGQTGRPAVRSQGRPAQPRAGRARGSG